MKFAYFYLLFLLPLLAAGAYFLFLLARKTARQKLARFGAASRLPQILRTLDPRAKKRKFLCILAALGLLVVAAARPLWGPNSDSADQNGAEFFFILDISKSMLVRDVPPSRLDSVKLSLDQWLKTRQGDRIGLILMAGDSFVQAPLTNDYTALREVLAQSGPRSIGLGGTNIPAAVNMAVSALEKSAIKNKVVVLISDGENLEGQAIPAIQNANLNNKIAFFTVGVGTASGGPVPNNDPGPDFKGPVKDIVRDEYGIQAHSRLDERSLRSIASAGSGKYYYLLPGHEKETWDALYEQSLKPYAKKHDEFDVRDYTELFQIPLLLAIAVLLLEMRISSRLKNPRRAASAVTLPEASTAPVAVTMNKKNSVSRVAAAASVLLLLFPAAPSALAATALLTTEQAEALVKSGKAVEAAEALRAEAQKNPDDLYALYNYGIASYAAGKFTEAIDAFSEVSLSRDEKLRSLASMQLGNAQYRLGQDLEKKSNLNGAILAFERSVDYYQAAIAERSNKTSENNLLITKDRLEKNLLKVGTNLFGEALKRPDAAAKVPMLTRAFELFEKAVALNPKNPEAVQKLEETRKLLSENLVTLARDAREKAKASDITKDKGKEKEGQNMLANQNYEQARAIDPNNAPLAAEHDAFKKEVADAFADTAELQMKEALGSAENEKQGELKRKEQALTKALVPIEKALAFDENNQRALDLKKTALANLEKLHSDIGDMALKKGEELSTQQKADNAAGSFAEAMGNYQKTLAINPGNEHAKTNLAKAEAGLAKSLTESGKNEMAKASNSPSSPPSPSPAAAPSDPKEAGKSDPAAGGEPSQEQMQKDIGHLEKAAASFAQAEALDPGKNEAAGLQEEANKKLADLRGKLDKAQNKGAGKEMAKNEKGEGEGKGEGKGEGQGEGEGEGEGEGKMAGKNSPAKPTLSFSSARVPGGGEGLYKDLRQKKKIRDW